MVTVQLMALCSANFKWVNFYQKFHINLRRVSRSW
jgi:hypothetical protein